MLQITQESKEKVLSAIKQGRIDAADISQPNFIDGIILKMRKLGVVDELCHIIEDKRRPNAVIPLNFILVLSIAAKMKIHTSLTDIPYAIMDIRFGTIKDHDLELSRDMILNSPMLKPYDSLINDRGFLSRDVLNELKARRFVDTYIPLRNNMIAYQDAVSIAKTENNWKPHPNKKRKTQKIAFVEDAGSMWQSEQPEDDVPLNACVVWDTKDDKYYVFVTTDVTKTAKQIIQTYELRPEIEEDYRQLKDFWKLEDFKSTKINVIAFHIVCTLLGYMMFQLYVGTEEGERWSGKSLPVILKKYIPTEKPKAVIIYTGQYFAVFPFVEFLHLYASLDLPVRSKLDGVLALV